MQKTPANHAAAVAGVLVRPPLAYLASIGLGFALHFLWPLRLFPTPPPQPIGAVVVAGAGLLFAMSIRAMRTARTPVRASRPTARLVLTGPYRWSRNPIYLAFTVLQAGFAVWVNTPWLLATLVPVVVLIHRGVILREERYLASRFGEAYEAYRRRVRRWI